MVRNGIVAVSMFFFFGFSSAAPIDLGSRLVVQPDGTSFVMHELVDEFGHYRYTDTGSVVQDSSTGYYYYSRYYGDADGDRVIAFPTSLRVGRDDESGDTMRLGWTNAALGEARRLRWWSRGGSEFDEPPETGNPAALCANGIAVPEPHYNLLRKDCEVLLAVRDSLTGSRYFLNWSTDIPISDWAGVAVSDGRVTGLDLQFPLAGSILPELGKLRGLKRLNLSYNGMIGTIPPELGQLIHLESLSLHSNELTGTIPPELGQLTQLKTLNLEFNELTGMIPTELAGLSELEELVLGYNELSGGIPPELGQLTLLEGLYLNDNGFTGSIPPELGRLVNLENLTLQGNALSGQIPKELGGLTRLQLLLLNDNLLTGPIPAGLGRLPGLVKLSLDSNQLSGAIPEILGQLMELEELWLGDNAFSGPIPPELGGLTQLRRFSLHNNILNP